MTTNKQAAGYIRALERVEDSIALLSMQISAVDPRTHAAALERIRRQNEDIATLQRWLLAARTEVKALRARK